MNNLEYIKIITPLITLLIGLFASTIIDWIRLKIKNRRTKKFIVKYLEKNILNKLSKMKEEYIKVRVNRIEVDTFGILKMEGFETFNDNVLQSIKPEEYYGVFKEKYLELNEIIATIRFLSLNLPVHIGNDYIDKINNHLIEKNKKGEIEHIKNCAFCKQSKDVALVKIEARIKDVEDLKEEIHKFIKDN